MFPNGITYYYFSDNQEFTWEALYESLPDQPIVSLGMGGKAYWVGSPISGVDPQASAAKERIGE